MVQKLVNESYASAGVAISSAPLPGVTSYSPHFLRANFPHVNPFAGNKPVFMTPERFHYAFANTLSREASDEGLSTLGMGHLGRTDSYYNATHELCEARKTDWRP